MRIAVVDTSFRLPALDGGSRAIVDLIRTAEELGHDVSIMTDRSAFTEAVESGARWDVVVLSRPDTAVRLVAVARTATETVIHLGHDLHHVRLAAEAAAGNVGAGVARAHLGLERQSWLRCDVSLYPDRAEVDAVDVAVGPGRAACFPYFRVDRIAPLVERPKDGPLVFVGGAGHSPNVTGLDWYASEVHPLLSPSATVQVIGEWPEARRPSSTHVRSFEYLGPLPSALVVDHLARASAMIAPLRTGAGLKSKVIDALAGSVPLVTTSIGTMGVDAEDAVAWVSDEADDWPDLIDRVRRGGGEVAQLCVAGGAYVEAVHGPDAFRRELSKILEGDWLSSRR